MIPVNPTGPEQSPLHQAFLRAFPDLNDLGQFLRYGLDLSPPEVYGADPLLGQAVNLLFERIDKDTRWREFLVAARRAKPNDTRLNGAIEEVFLVAAVRALEPLLGGDAVAKHAWESYDQARPEFALEVLASERRPAEFAAALAQAARGADGRHPLLVFAELLAGAVHEPVATPLQDWHRDMAELLGGAAASSAPRPDRVSPESVGPRFLVVQVVPLKQEPGQYRVHGALIDARGVGPRNLLDPPLRLTEAEVLVRLRASATAADLPRGLLLDLFARPEVANTPPDKMQVEFVLPRALLHEAADQSVVPLPAGQPAPVGTEHVVVLRTLERARPGRPREYLDWSRKHFAGLDVRCTVVEAFDAPPPHLAYCLAPGGHRGDALRLQLRRNRVLCCLLPDDPRNGSAGDAERFFDTVFNAGVPVVLWVRTRPPDCAALKRSLHDLVDNQPLQQLPDRVYDRRVNDRIVAENDPPGAPGWHLGEHLALLWDDPRRPAPEYDPRNQFENPR